MKFFVTVSILLAALAFSACNNSKTYIELRKEEDNAIDKFLSSDDHWVSNLPADGEEFETAENSDNPPYYKLEDGVYMQIQSIGYLDSTNTFFVSGDKVYFRYTRMSLTSWADGTISTSGNMSDASGSSDTYYFSYNPSVTGSTYSVYYEYGLGIEYPLKYVGNGALLYLIVPSKMGFSSEVSSVVPYLYKIKYNLKEN
ncbi:MAG: DUF4827 domain-containing protein [Porphyromonadaceae bacterium]|nr:DUF4827 domain-containing protein [Porphyromonadaceae bacterium]